MQKVISVTELSDAANVMILTDAGRIYVASKTNNWWSVWKEVVLPPYVKVEEIKFSEKVDDLGRLPKGYALYKRIDNGLFYWERDGVTPVEADISEMAAATPVTSQQFERAEGAIAGARTDYMIRHPQKPPPKPKQPEEQPV